MPSTIEQTIQQAIADLKSLSDSARIDAEILLAYVLEKDRTFLRTWPEQSLSEQQQYTFNQLLARRKTGEPIAYIIGHQEFWSLPFMVTADTLIPRAETELLVEQALQLIPTSAQWTILDAGTGSGAIAIALASEQPGCRIVASDIHFSSLILARDNARKNQISNISFVVADWLKPFTDRLQFDMIVSNPPYIMETDPHLKKGDVRFEPRRALTAGPAGLDAIKVILQQAQRCLKPGGWLLLEHGYHQAEPVSQLMQAEGYLDSRYLRDYGGQARVSLCQKPEKK